MTPLCVHYLKVPQKSSSITQNKQQVIITCFCVIRYIFYLSLCIYFYVAISFYTFLYLSVHQFIFTYNVIFYIFIDHILMLK